MRDEVSRCIAVGHAAGSRRSLHGPAMPARHRSSKLGVLSVIKGDV